MFHCSHPNALFQPHLHPRGCSGENLLGLGWQGCSGACSSPFSIPGAALENISLVLVAKDALELAPLLSPGFYSLLFVVL